MQSGHWQQFIGLQLRGEFLDPFLFMSDG